MLLTSFIQFLENPTEESYASALQDGWSVVSDSAIGEKRVVTFKKTAKVGA